MSKPTIEKKAEAPPPEVKPATLAKIAELSQRLRKLVYEERMKIQQAQNQSIVQLAVIGDLEGCIITAQEMARHDPERALARLTSAEKAFSKSK